MLSMPFLLAILLVLKLATFAAVLTAAQPAVVVNVGYAARAGHTYNNDLKRLQGYRSSRSLKCVGSHPGAKGIPRSSAQRALICLNFIRN